MAEHEDLGILGEIIHTMDGHELGDAADQAVGEAEGHDVAGSSSGSCLVKLRIGFLDPSPYGGKDETGEGFVQCTE